MIETYEVQALSWESRLLLGWIESLGGIPIFVTHGGELLPCIEDTDERVKYSIRFLESILRVDPSKFDVESAIRPLFDHGFLCGDHRTGIRITTDRQSKVRGVGNE